MDLTKQSIRRHFDRGAATYDRVAELQVRMGRELLALATAALGDRVPARIIELGCGTGVLTADLRAAWPDAELLANDLSPCMLDRARERLPGTEVRWLEADAETWLLSDAAPRDIDLLIANATVQWFGDPASTLRQACERLAPGGVLAVSSFGPDTFRELRDCFAVAEAELGMDRRSRTLAFLSAADWQLAFDGAPGLRVEVREQRETRHHPDLRDFLHAIRECGATLPAADGRASSLTRDLLSAVETAYERHFRQSPGLPATWHIIDLIVTRG